MAVYELAIAYIGAVNSDALRAELAAVLPDASDGFATDSRGLRLIFTRDLTSEEQDAAQAVVNAHDPAALTPEQQAAAERAAALAVLTPDVEAIDRTQPLSPTDMDKVLRYAMLKGLV